MNGPWIIRDPEQAAAAGVDLEAAEVLYVITVSDLADRYNQRHDPDDGGDGATWDALDPELKLKLIEYGGEYLETLNTYGACAHWADALDDAIAAVEGGI